MQEWLGQAEYCVLVITEMIILSNFGFILSLFETVTISLLFQSESVFHNQKTKREPKENMEKRESSISSSAFMSHFYMYILKSGILGSM